MIAAARQVLRQRSDERPRCRGQGIPSQLLPRRCAAAAAAASLLPRVPLLQVLAGQGGVQRRPQGQHAHVPCEARRVPAVHCWAVGGGLGGATLGGLATEWGEGPQPKQQPPSRNTASLGQPASHIQRSASRPHAAAAWHRAGHPPAPTLSLRVPRNRKQAGTARPMNAKSSPAIVPSVSPTWLGSGTSLRAGGGARRGSRGGGEGDAGSHSKVCAKHGPAHVCGQLGSHLHGPHPCVLAAASVQAPAAGRNSHQLRMAQRTCPPRPARTGTPRGRSLWAGSRACGPAASPPAKKGAGHSHGMTCC